MWQCNIRVQIKRKEIELCFLLHKYTDWSKRTNQSQEEGLRTVSHSYVRNPYTFQISLCYATGGSRMLRLVSVATNDGRLTIFLKCSVVYPPLAIWRRLPSSLIHHWFCHQDNDPKHMNKTQHRSSSDTKSTVSYEWSQRKTKF